MYERIVVPLDGSELAERALPHAEEIARLTGSPIHLVRVTDATPLARYGYHGPMTDYPLYEQLLTDEMTTSRAYLEIIERDLIRRGATVTHEIRHGSVCHELEVVTRPDDLIVMTSHGRGGVTRWFLGSVAEEVARRATVPVLLVRMALTPKQEIETASRSSREAAEPGKDGVVAAGAATTASVSVGNGLPQPPG